MILQLKDVGSITLHMFQSYFVSRLILYTKDWHKYLWYVSVKVKNYSKGNLKWFILMFKINNNMDRF